MGNEAIQFEERYGTLRPSALHAQSLGIKAFAGSCEISGKFMRIKNEPENYIEDRKVIHMSIVRLPEEQTQSKFLTHIQTIYSRKIKSNVENIL